MSLWFKTKPPRSFKYEGSRMFVAGNNIISIRTVNLESENRQIVECKISPDSGEEKTLEQTVR